MLINTHAIPRKRRNMECDWIVPMPKCVLEDSAFFFRVANTCLGRRLNYHKGEIPRLHQSCPISRNSVILHFSIPIQIAPSEQAGEMKVVNEIRIIAVCSLLPAKKIKISILHSISTKTIKTIQNHLNWRSTVGFEYGFKKFFEDDGRIRIVILGILHHYGQPRKTNWVKSVSSHCVVKKLCCFRDDQGDGLVTRMS